MQRNPNPVGNDDGLNLFARFDSLEKEFDQLQKSHRDLQRHMMAIYTSELEL
jgi:hypothetical protein